MEKWTRDEEWLHNRLKMTAGEQKDGERPVPCGDNEEDDRTRKRKRLI